MRLIARLVLALVAGCASSPDAQANAIAVRLVAEGSGKDLPTSLQTAYTKCGEEVLKGLPTERLNLAMRPTDTPAIWAALGSEALDRYVTECRKAETKASI